MIANREKELLYGYISRKQIEQKLKRRALKISPIALVLMVIIGFFYDYALNYSHSLFAINLMDFGKNIFHTMALGVVSIIMWFNALMIYVLIPIFTTIFVGSFILLIYLPLSLRGIKKDITQAMRAPNLFQSEIQS